MKVSFDEPKEKSNIAEDIWRAWQIIRSQTPKEFPVEKPKSYEVLCEELARRLGWVKDA